MYSRLFSRFLGRNKSPDGATFDIRFGCAEHTKAFSDLVPKTQDFSHTFSESYGQNFTTSARCMIHAVLFPRNEQLL